MKPRRALNDDSAWELFDTRTDFSLTHDLAAQNPKKLKELQALFLKEAKKNKVLPIDDRTLERMNPAIAGRPDLMAGRTSLTLAEGMTGMSENVFINVKNKSKTITAELDIPEGGANGAVLAQGGRFGGWCLYLKDGKPAYTYNYLNQNQYTISSAEALPKGKTSWCSSLPTMVAVWAKAAQAPCPWMAANWPKAVSIKPSLSSFPATKPRMSA